MDLRRIQAFRRTRLAGVPTIADPIDASKSSVIGPFSFSSRRRFLKTTGGLVAAGAAAATQLLRPSTLHAASNDPLPVPQNADFGGLRVYAPAPAGFGPGFSPIDAEPATISNFNGVVGLAYIDGTVTRTTISTGQSVELPFLFSDMRFMNGVYRGVDGKPRQGTFALI
jgi:hypothetical protein